MLNPELEQPPEAADRPMPPQGRKVGSERSTLDCAGNPTPSGANAPPQKPRHATVHPKCGRWWTGINTAHCTVCCRTFSTVAAFDAHRAGSHAHNTRHCLDPATIVYGPRSKHAGEPMLVDAGRDYPCWGFAGSDVKWWGGDVA